MQGAQAREGRHIGLKPVQARSVASRRPGQGREGSQSGLSGRDAAGAESKGRRGRKEEGVSASAGIKERARGRPDRAKVSEKAPETGEGAGGQGSHPSIGGRLVLAPLRPHGTPSRVQRGKGAQTNNLPRRRVAASRARRGKPKRGLRKGRCARELGRKLRDQRGSNGARPEEVAVIGGGVATGTSQGGAEAGGSGNAIVEQAPKHLFVAVGPAQAPKTLKPGRESGNSGRHRKRIRRGREGGRTEIREILLATGLDPRMVKEEGSTGPDGKRGKGEHATTGKPPSQAAAESSNSGPVEKGDGAGRGNSLDPGLGDPWDQARLTD